MPYGVLDQVAREALQQAGVAEDRCRGTGQLHLELSFGHLGRHGAEGGLNDPLELDPFPQGQPVDPQAVAAGEQQQAVDQPVSPDAGISYDLRCRPQLVDPGRRICQRDVDLGAHDGKGRTQLVTRVGHEPALGVEGGLEPAEHVVEGVGESLELVLRSGQVDPCIEALHGQALRGGGDLLQRTQHAPGDQVGHAHPHRAQQQQRQQALSQQRAERVLAQPLLERPERGDHVRARLLDPDRGLGRQGAQPHGPVDQNQGEQQEQQSDRNGDRRVDQGQAPAQRRPRAGVPHEPFRSITVGAGRRVRRGGSPSRPPCG